MHRTSIMLLTLGAALVSLSKAGAEDRVSIHRLPPGAVQPQVAVDNGGIVHLIYLAGDPAHSDIFYVRSGDHGVTWSSPSRVNRQPGSAIALGTVRGPHLALGRNGYVHVAWMGSSLAQPKAPGKRTPMLYARLRGDGSTFEPQRNVIAAHPGLDGGASIAADQAGNVWVAWHAPERDRDGEQDRRVWVARSVDDGKGFAPEVPVSPAATGACGCCGMRVAAADGKFFVLYRGASEQVNRGMYRVVASTDLSDPRVCEIAPMKIGICVMSTAALAPAPRGLLAAWETGDDVFWSRFDPAGEQVVPHSVPRILPANRKHPAIASSSSGQVLLAWAEGTGWNKGGAVGWQVFGPNGHPVAAGSGHAADLPAWDSPAVFTRPDGGFVIVY
ncbi:MAG TPA: sialidase family protein [Tepidisphaeraceae bacterium]|nr:sialidase family protein [Tepidisphaeraceae bacterium]